MYGYFQNTQRKIRKIFSKVLRNFAVIHSTLGTLLGKIKENFPKIWKMLWSFSLYFENILESLEEISQKPRKYFQKSENTSGKCRKNFWKILPNFYQIMKSRMNFKIWLNIWKLGNFGIFLQTFEKFFEKLWKNFL